MKRYQRRQKRRRRGIRLFSVLLIAVCLLFAGCSRGGKKGNEGGESVGANRESTGGTEMGGETRADREDIVYVPKYSSVEYAQETQGFEFKFISGIFMSGNKLFVIGTRVVEGKNVTAAFSMDILTGEMNWREVGIEEDQNVSCFARTDEGMLVLLFGYDSRTHRRYLKLERWDLDFNCVGEVNLSPLETALGQAGDSLNVNDIGMDDAGYVGIINNDSLYILDSEGSYLFSVSGGDGVDSIDGLYTVNGEMLALCRNEENELLIYRIDTENRRLGEALSGMPKLNWRTDVVSAGKGIYIKTDDSLYLYHADGTEEAEKLLDWVSIGTVMGDSAGTCFTVTEDGTIMMANALYDADWNIVLEMLALTPTPADVVKTRTKLTLAVMTPPFGDLERRIADFNKYNEDYYIEIKSYNDQDYYFDAAGKEKYDQALSEFNKDLLAGNIADMFWVYGNDIDIRGLARKGVLADLYTFIDKDDEIKREDFIPNILKAMECEGGLYALSSSFSLDTLVGKTKYVGECEDEWSSARLLKILEENPDMELFSGMFRSQGLPILTRYCVPMFYNEETGECSFDSEEFAGILKLAATIPVYDPEKQYDFNGESLPNKLYHDKTLLYNISIGSFEYIQMAQAIFGEEVSFIGYPTGEACGAVINLKGSGCGAISELSPNKEGAWAFLRSFVTYDAQNGTKWGLSFPVHRTVFEEMLEQEKQQPRVQGMSFDDVRITVLPLTKEREEIILDMVYSACVSGYDEVIETIITEEAGGFFAGQRTAEEAAAAIQDRVQLYIDENR